MEEKEPAFVFKPLARVLLHCPGGGGFERRSYRVNAYLPILFSFFKSAFSNHISSGTPGSGGIPEHHRLIPQSREEPLTLLKDTFHQMKGKENGLDNVLHAVLLIYFHCFISRKISYLVRLNHVVMTERSHLKSEMEFKKITEKEFMK